MSIWVWLLVAFTAYVIWTIIAVVHLLNRFGQFGGGPNKLLEPPLYVLKIILDIMNRDKKK